MRRVELGCTSISQRNQCEKVQRKQVSDAYPGGKKIIKMINCWGGGGGAREDNATSNGVAGSRLVAFQNLKEWWPLAICSPKG